MNLKAIIHEAEEGGYWAEVPALPGCVTQGDTMDEVTANLREAIAITVQYSPNCIAGITVSVPILAVLRIPHLIFFI